MPPTKVQLTSKPVAPVSAHAFNKDRSLLAISPNTEEIKILAAKGASYPQMHSLMEHGQRVTAIDWDPINDRIVTAGQDRNAYVWKKEGSKWKPTLVILRTNRAATCAKWSPKGDKFAVGTGARLISVCYFEDDNDWWVSKHVKKPIRSTVLSLDWHPNNVLIAAGSSDFKARVFSGYIKSVDEKPGPTVWGKKMPFGNCMAEFGTSDAGGGWVHDVSFSASGDQLAYVSHDSSITVVDGTQDMKVFRLETKNLPLRAVTWITPKSIVAAGHDYVPFVYTFDGSNVKEIGKLDVPPKAAGKTMSAMDKFRTLDRKGTTSATETATSVDSTHQNAISEISIHTGDKSGAKKIATVGVDGVLVLWDLSSAASEASITIA